MIEVIKIIRIYKSGRREVEKPEYLTFADKKQIEIYRGYLIRTGNNIENVFFTYEEH